jgi:hypothetical protein
MMANIRAERLLKSRQNPARAAYPQRRSSNASGLRGRNSARILGIRASFQRDNLRRHFRVRVLLYRGGLVSSAFRLLRRSDMGCHSQVLASLRDRHSGPPMMGSEGCGGPTSRYVLAVRLTAGIKTRNGLASSIVLRGTSFHRSAEFTFLLFLLCTTRCEIHERHKCALTARALLFARSR